VNKVIAVLVIVLVAATPAGAGEEGEHAEAGRAIRREFPGNGIRHKVEARVNDVLLVMKLELVRVRPLAAVAGSTWPAACRG